MPVGELDDPRRVGVRVPGRYDVEAVDLGFRCRFECPVEFGKIADFDRQQLEIQGLCRALGHRQFVIGMAGIADKPNPGNAGGRLLERFEPLGREFSGKEN